MAKVYTLEELTAQVSEFINRLNSVNKSLAALRVLRENMYNQGESLSVIDTAMNLGLADIKTMADQAGTDIGNMLWLNAPEIRIGLERKIARFGMDLQNGNIAMDDDDDGAVSTLGTLFVAADVVEVIGAADDQDSRLITLFGAQSAFGLEFANIPGGAVSSQDTVAKIIMREDASA